MVRAVLLLALGGCGSHDDASGDEGDLVGNFPVGAQLHTIGKGTLRSEPSPTARVMTTIPKGVTVFSASAHPRANWYGVSWQGKTGWVAGKSLAKGPGMPSSGPFTRAEVHELISGHLRAGEEASANDFLDPNLTTQSLINAVGWIANHSAVAWEISAVNTNHHFDPEAHSSGLAVDCYSVNPADDAQFVSSINQNPFIVEVGLSGEFVSRRPEIHGKFYFTEDAPSHVHIAVRQAFGTMQ